MRPGARGPSGRGTADAAVTVSRQTGAGGSAFGESLCTWLERAQPKGRGPWAALAYVEAEDRARQRFIRRTFQVDVNDPLLYNLVINVDRIPIDEAARIVGDAVLART